MAPATVRAPGERGETTMLKDGLSRPRGNRSISPLFHIRITYRQDTRGIEGEEFYRRLFG